MEDRSRRGARGLTRREFARAGSALLLGLGATPWLARRAGASEQALVTDIQANEGLIKSLQYVNQSPRPDQRCANCVLYQTPEEPKGKCPLFAQGVVAAEGWCISWSPRPS